MILDRYEGVAFVIVEARTVDGVVQLTSWQGDDICYWGGVLHLTSLKDRDLAVASAHVFLTTGGPEVYVTVGPGDEPDGPLAVTGHGEPPFGAPDRSGGLRWA